MKYSSSNSNNRIDKKVYLGSAQGPFKQRYYTHKCNFTHEVNRHKTSLSKYVWEVKRKFGLGPILKWEIMKRCSKYRGGRYCKLRMEEKLTIPTYNKPKELLNQRSDIVDICRHRKKKWIKRLIKIVQCRKKKKKIFVYANFCIGERSFLINKMYFTLTHFANAILTCCLGET